jgi:hypothetical protein
LSLNNAFAYAEELIQLLVSFYLVIISDKSGIGTIWGNW